MLSMGAFRRKVVDPLLAILLVIVFLTPARAERARHAGWVEIVSSTIGAEVFVDGEQVGQVPLPDRLALPVGEHSVKVSKRGFTQHLEVIGIKRGMTTVVAVDLLALSGVLRVEVDQPGARVFVDGDYVGEAPLVYDVDPGSREITVSAGGYRDLVRTVEVVAGEEVRVAAELERLPPEQDPTRAPPPPPRRWYEQWWVWTTVGAVVVAVAVAVPLGIIAAQDADMCRREADWPDGCSGALVFDFTD
jgi:hypothetical protein